MLKQSAHVGAKESEKSGGIQEARVSGEENGGIEEARVCVWAWGVGGGGVCYWRQ